MENSRREFLKKAAMLSGGLGMMQALPASLARAMAIDPVAGSTFLDAEHVVFLMQENRSFDHTYGTLQGVRGFDDPRAIRLPNGNPVFLQSTKAGDTYAPFRLNMFDTKATWMSSLPHSWANQVDARNNGLYDQWLPNKQSGNDEYQQMPLTLGYYNRQDIPFYYALADAFTVCDHNFCSSLTGTTPNRLYFWTGTIREKDDPASLARVWNEDADYDTMVSWKTFPERLEEWNIPWKIYQNEITADTGFEGEEESWLANFGDNPIEYFSQFMVKMSKGYIDNLPRAEQRVRVDLAANQAKTALLTAGSPERTELERTIRYQEAKLKRVIAEQTVYTHDKYEAMPAFQKSIHQKAFVNNSAKEDYRQLEPLEFEQDGVKRTFNIPKGDVLYQFREDVNTGKLPLVSWLTAPENFSDHPSSAWYGAWYVSEVLDILTKNPEVWKKTIFILTYDENDGYFDHLPPFVAPHPSMRQTGATSPVMDTALDYVVGKEQQSIEDHTRTSPIGLGYRVPMVIASPWTRGGWVNSQVFDHTSSLRFLERFLSAKTGKEINEPNITQWRRTICGDLTSVFRPYDGEKIGFPVPLQAEKFLVSIREASEKKLPSDYRVLDKEEIADAQQGKRPAIMPRQEPGTRPSNALPYELSADLAWDVDSVRVIMRAEKQLFAERSAGGAFTVYDAGQSQMPLNYAVAPGHDVIHQAIRIAGAWNISIHGPNGFYRDFKGSSSAPMVGVTCSEERGAVNKGRFVKMILANRSASNQLVTIKDLSYGADDDTVAVSSGSTQEVMFDLGKSQGWYDLEVSLSGKTSLLYRYAGRVENGLASITDPLIGKA